MRAVDAPPSLEVVLAITTRSSRQSLAVVVRGAASDQ
jgi:hypothetical protein